MRIYKEASLSNYVELDEKRIHLFVTEWNDDELVQKVFNKWWRQTAKEIYQSEVDSYYDKVIRKYNVDKPTVTIKKMKTLWGSCSPSKMQNHFERIFAKSYIRSSNMWFFMS